MYIEKEGGLKLKYLYAIANTLRILSYQEYSTSIQYSVFRLPLQIIIY